jgi:hypothetical protein
MAGTLAPIVGEGGLLTYFAFVRPKPDGTVTLCLCVDEAGEEPTERSWSTLVLQGEFADLIIKFLAPEGMS